VRPVIPALEATHAASGICTRERSPSQRSGRHARPALRRRSTRPAGDAPAELIALAYELLDAHADTAALAAAGPPDSVRARDEEWARHLAYVGTSSA